MSPNLCPTCGQWPQNCTCRPEPQSELAPFAGMPLAEIIETLDAACGAICAVHSTMYGTVHFQRDHLDMDRAKVMDMLDKLQKLRRHVQVERP